MVLLGLACERSRFGQIYAIFFAIAPTHTAEFLRKFLLLHSVVLSKAKKILEFGSFESFFVKSTLHKDI